MRCEEARQSRLTNAQYVSHSRTLTLNLYCTKIVLIVGCWPSHLACCLRPDLWPLVTTQTNKLRKLNIILAADMEQLELYRRREKNELKQVPATAAALLFEVDENLVRDIEIGGKGDEGGSFNGDSADPARRKRGQTPLLDIKALSSPHPHTSRGALQDRESSTQIAEKVQGWTLQQEDKEESRREGLSKNYIDNVKYSGMSFS